MEKAKKAISCVEFIFQNPYVWNEERSTKMTAAFYLMTAFIWGTTWYGVKLQQVSGVPFAASNLYRFVIAFVVLVLFALNKKRLWPKLFLKDHLFMAIQGLFLYCLNYSCYMESVAYIPSGLTSVSFSTIIIFNTVFSALFLNLPVTRQMFLGAFSGIIGLCVIFSEHVFAFQSGGPEIYGVLFGVGGAFLSSIGHILTKKAQMRGADVIQNGLYSMGYGVGWWVLYVGVSGTPLSFDMSVPYTSSLLYLSVIGTALAFILYLMVLRDIGPGKAAYIFIISPVVALIVSALMEGYVWSYTLILGLTFVIAGNVLMLRKPVSR